jgi:hypothetical protein
MKTVDFDAWLRAAKPGDSVVYHRGLCWSVAWERTADGERTNSQRRLLEVAEAVRRGAPGAAQDCPGSNLTAR